MTATARRPGNRSPYAVEELTVILHRSRLGAAWRWRTELFTLAVMLTAWWWLTRLTGGALWGLLVFLGILAVLLTIPHSRQFLAARLWCLVTRHRLQRAFWELRLHTRAGHLPLILWTHGTKVGERVFVLARAGTCAADFENTAPELAAACAAREARITASPRWSQLVTIDILRRDLLTARHVASTLSGLAGPIIVPSQRVDSDTDPEPEPATWPELAPGDTRS